MKNIDELRKGIDAVDKELAELFTRRMAISRAIGEYKRKNGLPVYDAERERAVIRSRVACAKAGDSGYMESFFTTVMELSKEAQRKETIPPAFAKKGTMAYQGIPGAYSEEAAKKAYGGALVAKDTFEDVFSAVSSGETDYGIIPVENSFAGSVAENYDLLARYDVGIMREEVLPIHHVLLGVKNAELPDIKTVWSHSQGLLQCGGFLRERGYELLTCANTALAARMVAESGDVTKAAVASRHAGEIYGLKVLAEDIQSSAVSSTRFFVIGRSGGRTGSRGTVVFTVKNSPGTLVAALSAICDHGINMTKIESRPLMGKSWEYRFFADIEGEGMENIENILSEAAADARLLGIYEREKL